MEPALWAAKTGLDAQQTQMTVTANNLANVNTNGFKASRAVFEDLLYQNVTQVGANTSHDHASPVRPAARHRRARGRHRDRATRRAASTRPATRWTSRSRDAASSRSCMPDGTLAYTRDGSFQVNAQGQLVTAERLPGAARDHHSARARRASRSAPTARSACSSPDQTAPTTGRHAAARRLHQSGRPAGSQGGNLLVESASSGTATTGTPGAHRPGHARAGLGRELQRQRRGGDGQHDRDPARLRDELQGRARPPTRCCSTPTRTCNRTDTQCEISTTFIACRAPPLSWPAAAPASREAAKKDDDDGLSWAAEPVPPAHQRRHLPGRARGGAVRESDRPPRRRHRHDRAQRADRRAEERQHQRPARRRPTRCPA